MRSHLTFVAVLSLFCSIGVEANGAENISEFSDHLVKLSARTYTSVVEIRGSGYQATFSNDGRPTIGEQSRNGSGIIVSRDGYIVTNAHVVVGARHLRVHVSPAFANTHGLRHSILRRKSQILPAEIVGFDRETDIAVIKADIPNAIPAPLGNSDEVKRGQIVLAFGSPLGLEGSVSMGVVSAVARQLSPEHPMVYIQTDAPINPGNSGGPLVNVDGEVIGINTFIISKSGGNEGIGFAVPSDIVQTVYRQLRKHGKLRRGVVGLKVQTITPTLAEALGLAREYGVIVSDVFPGSPADGSGIVAGDIILSLDGRTMENGRQFDVNLYHKPLGEPVVIEYLHGEETRRTAITVVERRDALPSILEQVDPIKNRLPNLGILAMELTGSLARQIQSSRFKGGVIVAGVTSVSRVEGRSFQSGDIIHSINGNPIRSLSQLRALDRKLTSGAALGVHIERAGRMMYLPMRVQ